VVTKARPDDLGTAIERTIADKKLTQAQLGYATTQLMLIRETSSCEKTRALAAGAVETLRAMRPPVEP